MPRNKEYFNGINVFKNKRFGEYSIYTSCEFFSGQIVYRVLEDSIEFRRPQLSDVRRIIKPHLVNGTKCTYLFRLLTHHEIEPKKYEFDEDSNEDVKIVYFK